MWLRLGQMQFECMDWDTDPVRNLKLNQWGKESGHKLCIHLQVKAAWFPVGYSPPCCCVKRPIPHNGCGNVNSHQDFPMLLVRPLEALEDAQIFLPCCCFFFHCPFFALRGFGIRIGAIVCNAHEMLPWKIWLTEIVPWLQSCITVKVAKVKETSRQVLTGVWRPASVVVPVLDLQVTCRTKIWTCYYWL